MKPLQVAFIWHMHQPYYKNDMENSFLLPWVRLRCAKDYYKMPALLDEYPGIKQTFNLVPALVDQVRNYVDGDVDDVYLELSRRPVSELSGAVRRTRYACSGGSEVELVTIEGGGHSWPGGDRLARFLDPPSPALDATAEIWRFFARH